MESIKIKCITFDNEAQDNLPKEILDKMKKDRQIAELKQVLINELSGKNVEYFGLLAFFDPKERDFPKRHNGRVELIEDELHLFSESNEFLDVLDPLDYIGKALEPNSEDPYGSEDCYIPNSYFFQESELVVIIE